MCIGAAPGPPTPCPILPRDRSNVDKVSILPYVSDHYKCRTHTHTGCTHTHTHLPGAQMVEYLVGDGPNNRYALICSKCKSHNGMALRDEFEYLTFRCAYCYDFNEARKKRPTLERPPSISGSEIMEEVDMTL